MSKVRIPSEIKLNLRPAPSPPDPDAGLGLTERIKKRLRTPAKRWVPFEEIKRKYLLK